jgi:hypothetical protein
MKNTIAARVGDGRAANGRKKGKCRRSEQRKHAAPACLLASPGLSARIETAHHKTVSGNAANFYFAPHNGHLLSADRRVLRYWPQNRSSFHPEEKQREAAE